MPVNLLVSVRSPQEALAALDGGADIIDVKEPTQGSLGRSESNVVAEITDLVHSRSPGTIVSAALGEVAESPRSEAIDLTQAARLDLVKSGLSGLHQGLVPWQDAWHRFRENVVVTRPTTQWVAVAYADAQRSRSPHAVDVLDEGHRIGCPVLLIDTFQKDGTSLLDWVATRELDRIRCRTRDYGMKMVLAGQITTTLLPEVLAVDPDIIAVRGAVCEYGNRGATVTAERVRQLVTVLRKVATTSAVK